MTNHPLETKSWTDLQMMLNGREISCYLFPRKKIKDHNEYVFHSGI